MLTKPFKGMTLASVSQSFHDGHKAIDLASFNSSLVSGYGTPLCAMEDSRILKITGDSPVDETTAGLERGYGIYLRGLETGYSYLYWHCLPWFPVWGGDIVKRGQIVAYMGNAGNVRLGNNYVPINERTAPAKAGTHLHLEMFDKGYVVGGKKKFLNPLEHISMLQDPIYTFTDQLKATLVVLSKIVKSVKKI